MRKKESDVANLVLATLGLGALFAWDVHIMSSGMTVFRDAGDAVSLDVVVRLVLFLAIAMVCPGRMRRMGRTGRLALTCGAVIACTACTLAGSFAAPVKPCLSSAAYVALLLLWLHVAESLPAHHQGLPLCLSVAACFVFTALPLPSLLADVVLPLLSLAALLACRDGIWRNRAAGPAPQGETSLPEGRPWGGRSFQTAALCLMVCLLASAPIAFFDVGRGGVDVAFGLVAAVAFVALTEVTNGLAARVRPTRGSRRLPVAVLLFFCGMAALMLAGQAAQPLAATYLFVGGYLCRALIYEASLGPGGPWHDGVRWHCVLSATMIVGQLLGRTLGTAAVRLSSLSTVVAVVGLALLCVLSWLLVGRAEASGKDGIGDAPGNPAAGRDPSLALDDACRLLAERASAEMGLTEREVEVLALLLQGMNAPMVAERMALSTSTVKSHMDRLYKKAGVHSREELVALVRMER